MFSLWGNYLVVDETHLETLEETNALVSLSRGLSWKLEDSRAMRAMFFASNEMIVLNM